MANLASETATKKLLNRVAAASGPIVAERNFVAETGARMRLEIHAPSRDLEEGSLDFQCTFSLEEGGYLEMYRLIGVDTCQALQLCIEASGKILEELGIYSWEGMFPGVTGFSRALPTDLPIEAQKRLMLLVAPEVAKEEELYWAAQRARRNLNSPSGG